MPSSNPDSRFYTIQIPRGRVTGFLVLVVLVLLVNHVMLQVFHYQLQAGHWVLRGLFDVDEEENFPTYYSAFALLFSAALLYAIACRKASEQDRYTRHWFGLTLGFAAMSVDEVAGMHEALNTVTDFSWTIPAAMVLVVVASLYVKFLLHLPVPTRIGFLLAGMMFAGGAIGVEHATDWYLENQSMDTLGYNLLTTLEEGLEMLGVVLFIHSLLGYMDPQSPRISLEIDANE